MNKNIRKYSCLILAILGYYIIHEGAHIIVATLAAAWILVLLRKRICAITPQFPRSLLYYLTMITLFLDPLYLSILCGFVGGGDMNGIKLLCSEFVIRTVFGIMGLFHIFVFWKVVLPEYQNAFEKWNKNQP